MKNHRTPLLLSLFSFLLFLSPNLYAQRPLLRPLQPTSPDKAIQENGQNKAILQNIQRKAKAGKATVFGFDKSVLQDTKLLLQLPTGELIEAIMDEKDVRAPDDFSWHGHLKGRPGSVVFVLLDDQMSGNVVIENKNYSLSPLGKGACILYEIEGSQYPEDHPKSYREDTTPATPMNLGDASTADHCGVIRLLVAYTPAAERGALSRGFSNIKLFIQQAISETNQSYLNSRISHRVALAVAIRVAYTESGSFDTDLGRFRGTADGFMDEVHTYRNRYTADLGVILINNGAACGLASDIGSTAATAFCAVHYDCALGNYSFAHEIGHLHGCRHDPATDGALTPFPYGHGFCYGPGNWRTIMSYNSCGTSSTRLQYWSNPNITYGGVAMGTAERHHDARVLNETAGTLASYSLSPDVLKLTENESLKDNEVGFATATIEVVLSDGFVVAENSELRVAVMVPACDAPLTSTLPASAGEKTAETTEAVLSEPALLVSPVPTTGVLEVALNLPKAGMVDINIFNLWGTRVQSVYTGQLTRKRFNVDLSRLPEGIYIVRCQTATGFISKKVILKK